MATHRGRARGLSVLAAAAFLAQSLVVAAPVAMPTTALTAAAATLPSGFVDETIVTGLSNPTAITYAPGGRVFVAEKRGIIKTWASVASFNNNDDPVQTLDIRTDVMNYWDRGLLGMTVDPAWPANPYLYILYAYDAEPGGSAPRWNSGDADSDPCPTPPGGTNDGCTITSRLERITVSPTTGVMTDRNLLLAGWCQQFPSHSAGTVAFGPDGMLYVSGGEGASFNIGAQDYGNKGGTQSGTPTQRNPCDDPPGGAGGSMSAPTAEGGALRSQSFRRSSDEPAVLGGAVLRLNPATGDAAAGNHGSASLDPIRQRIVAYGFRNPFRMTFRPGTSELYVGDVGYSTWEEINRLTDTDASSSTPNFGWPCQEGPDSNTYYTSVTLNLCSSLDPDTVTGPLYDYRQSGHMATNDGCPPADGASASASISGLVFTPAPTYPSQYRNGLFVADYSRNCIVYLPAGSGGVPSSTAKPFESNAATPVTLTTDPNGNIVYGDFGGGKIHRIRYAAPVASFTATPPTGSAPLHVTFNGSASTGPSPIVSYNWDFDDGSTDSGVTTSHTYALGTYTAKLTVTDSNGMTASATRTIAAGNTAPVVTIDSPSCTTNCWQVGDDIVLSAHATDKEDGDLPDSAFSWHVGLQHCHSATDCHEHDLLDPTGASPGDFPAPDHDAGSYLRIRVTVTDSGGLTATKSIDVHPRQTTMTIRSSPAGVRLALDGVNGTSVVGPQTMIVGHSASVQAPATAVIGWATYGFTGWSDGGDPVHSATAPASPTTLTASYQQIVSDAPDTCAAAPIRTLPSGAVLGQFEKANDVDWVRFKTTSTGWYRFVLGGLPVNGTLALYNGCSSLVASVNASGTHWEEIVLSLKPGTYALRMASVGGVTSATPHRFTATQLSGITPLLGVTTVPSSGLRYVGDILNTSSSPRSVTVTARLYSASGKLLATHAVHTLVPVLGGRSRSPFVIATTRPTGFQYVRFTVTSTAASTATRLLAVSGSASAPTSSTWRINGTVTNTSSKTATRVAYVAEIYDAFGLPMNATASSPSKTTLTRGAKATFTVTFSGLSAGPSGTTLRARAI